LVSWTPPPGASAASVIAYQIYASPQASAATTTFPATSATVGSWDVPSKACSDSTRFEADGHSRGGRGVGSDPTSYP
jgi:hypothetical protein